MTAWCMPSQPDAPRPVTKLPDHTEALKGWLQAHGLGSMTEAGFAPLALYTLAARRPDLPPMPADVLFAWSVLLYEAQVMGRQAAAAFISEARKAGVTDERIRRALLVDDDVDVDEHADLLVKDARAFSLRRHERGMDWPSLS